MATRKYETDDEVQTLTEGDLGWGALVRDGDGLMWLAYDTDDTTDAIRPYNDDDDPNRRTPVRCELVDLPRPLYVTTEEK